uniref:Uncharacterized protein AlNc14C60G4436 n=1 Tax=Albugo laibachii Nc14 TaxID=890382 RepID=F0WCQ5_9STRA|nr:conserved hypothetical protein [Albugo laibachii Nc14]|eukprot:CCA18976.1 conserved hypothetical protein [Albugo laibachii Nc14]
MISSSRIASIRSIRVANEARIEAKKLEMDTKAMEDRLCAVRMSVLRDQQQLELERSQMHNGHRWKSSRKGHGKAELKSETRNVFDNQLNENTKKANQLQRSENVRKWNHCEIQNWLAQIGLEEYGAAFEFNNVTGAILLKLENQDLAHLGMETPSARDRMLKAIKALRYGKASFAKDTEKAKRIQRETLEDKPSRIHWSHTAPMAGIASEHQTLVNAADAEDAGHSSYINRALEWKGQEANARSEDTLWSNPAFEVTNGELIKGTLNEEKEHEAFRAAVLAWRTAARPVCEFWQAKLLAMLPCGNCWSNDGRPDIEEKILQRSM